MGDGLLVYFGYPQAHEDEAENAVHAGLDLVARVSQLLLPSGEPLATRVGIATGVVIVGETIGGGSTQEQSAVGETLNLAARLQALAQPNSVVIADATRRLLGGGFVCEQLGVQELKGFSEPVSAFKVTGERVVESRFDARRATKLTHFVGRQRELRQLSHLGQMPRKARAKLLFCAASPASESRARLSLCSTKLLEIDTSQSVGSALRITLIAHFFRRSDISSAQRVSSRTILQSLNLRSWNGRCHVLGKLSWQTHRFMPRYCPSRVVAAIRR
jgi:hypothetical protein